MNLGCLRSKELLKQGSLIKHRSQRKDWQFWVPQNVIFKAKQKDINKNFFFIFRKGGPDSRTIFVIYRIFQNPVKYFKIKPESKWGPGLWMCNPKKKQSDCLKKMKIVNPTG